MLSADRYLLILVGAWVLSFTASTTPAIAQVGVDLPDFYTRPRISPYVDFFRRNDVRRDPFRDPLTYQRQILRDFRILEYERNNLREQRQIRQDFQRDIDDRTQQILQELGPQTTGRGLPEDSRRLNPFYRPSYNKNTGASNNIRQTGHPVSFGGGGGGRRR